MEFGQTLLPNSFPIAVNSQIRENELGNREGVWNSAKMATLLYYLIHSLLLLIARMIENE